MTTFHAIILGLLQGLTELFPVSSLGHSVLLPHILGWNIDERENSFLIFLVVTHLATSLVLFGFYAKEWVEIIKGMFRSLKNREIKSGDSYAKLGWLLVVATIPAGVLGLLFEEKFKTLFASPIPVSIFLLLNGVMLIGIEKIKKNKNSIKNDNHSVERISKMSFNQSLKIGVAQCLALLPGFSRTGATLSGGLLSGLDHLDAAHFSFLLATPIIFAASTLKIPELISTGNTTDINLVLIGAVSSAVAAYVAVKFLSKYFKTKTQTPFGFYCLIAGAISLIYFIF